jgi:hypothetical protein
MDGKLCVIYARYERMFCINFRFSYWPKYSSLIYRRFEKESREGLESKEEVFSSSGS